MKYKVVFESGEQSWRLDGKLHRLDGPASIHPNGFKMWCRNGLLHRTDGPAIEWPGGTVEWFLEDKQINCKTQEEFERLMKLKAFW